MSEEEIDGLVTALGGIRAVLLDADPRDKAEVYKRLGLRLNYRHEARTVRAEIDLDPWPWGYDLCPRGDSDTIPRQSCPAIGVHVDDCRIVATEA